MTEYTKKYISSEECEKTFKPERLKEKMIMKSHFFFVVFMVALFGVLSVTCGCNEKKSFKDPRDGQTYSSVKIGDQIWMAQNLNYDMDDSGSFCINCERYGRYYTLVAAKKACPSGWHLPSIDEWATLALYAENYRVQHSLDEELDDMFRSTSGWLGRDGTDRFGFSILPAGQITTKGRIVYTASSEYELIKGGVFDGWALESVGRSEVFWTSTKSKTSDAYVTKSRWYLFTHNFTYDHAAEMGGYEDIENALSVRCIKDSE